MAALFSQSWHAVGPLKPRLADHVVMHRRYFRGQLWYVAQDPVTARYHRLTPGAYAIVAAMDGRRTVDEIWQDACARMGEELPGQEQLVQLLGQLHAQDMLVADISPDHAELLRRNRKTRWQNLRKRLLDPLSMKWPLLNPDPLLDFLAPRLSFLFGWVGALLWLAAVLPALTLLPTHWTTLTTDLSDQILATDNLIILWCVYPCVKALHELGHGLVTKAGGGRVREMGVILMFFAPIPYVDASSSYAFDSKWKRALVAAAGILVELWLAAIALLVWVAVEPGVVRAIAFNVMVIGGVSTLLVNGNPLMRFDGYFIFCDLLEMPNLAQRGSRYLGYLSDRTLFRAPGLTPPRETAAERRWLFVYAIVSWVYRISISIGLILLIVGKYFFFGVILGAWLSFSMVCLPLWKAWKHVHEGGSLFRVRQRAIRLFWGIVVASVLLLGGVPVPFRTQSEGVVWLPEPAIVRAAMDGFIDTPLVAEHTPVEAGQVLALLRNDNISSELAVNQARLDEAQAKLRSSMAEDAVRLDVASKEVRRAEQDLHLAQLKAQALIVTAGSAGRFVPNGRQALAGRYFKRGEIIGYIDAPKLAPVVRAVVNQDDIDLVRARARAVAVRLVDNIPAVLPARILREVPAGLEELPTPALALSGGGEIPTDPQHADKPKALQRHFQFDLATLETLRPGGYGARVYVRFDFGYRPLAVQGFVRLRQLFLRYLNV